MNTVSKQSKSTTFEDQYGNQVIVRKLSVRLAEFLIEYPPKEGWAIKVRDKVISSKDGPPYVSFRAHLVSPDGKELTDASSFGRLVDNKDWQRLESNARSRLLAALGYGSELIDEDETQDFIKSGLSPVDSAPAHQLTSNQNQENEIQETSVEESGVSESVSDEGHADLEDRIPLDDEERRVPEADSEDNQVFAMTESEQSLPRQNEVVSPLVKVKIKRLAEELGIDIPAYANTDEARKVLDDLTAKKSGLNK